MPVGELGRPAALVQRDVDAAGQPVHPARRGRRRTARRPSSRCAGRRRGLRRSARGPRRRRRRPAGTTALSKTAHCSVQRSPSRCSSGSSSSTAAASSAHPADVRARRLHRVEAVGEGPVVVGGTPGRQRPAGQPAGVGEVELRAPQHGQPAQDVGLHGPVAEVGGQAEALAQRRLAVGGRLPQGHRHVTGELPQHGHPQPAVAGPAGGLAGGGEVVEGGGEVRRRHRWRAPRTTRARPRSSVVAEVGGRGGGAGGEDRSRRTGDWNRASARSAGVQPRPGRRATGPRRWPRRGRRPPPDGR